MNIDLSTKTLPELKQMGQQFPHAGASVLNRFARKVKTRVSSEIRKSYNIKKKDLDPFIQFNPKDRATAKRLQARLHVSSKGIPLAYFGVRVTSKKRIVSVAVKRGQRARPKGAFVATMRHGKNVFIRVGPGRGDVKALYGPSIAQLFGGRHIRAIVDAMVNTDLAPMLRHEITFRLSRAGTKGAGGESYGEQGELVSRGAAE